MGLIAIDDGISLRSAIARMPDHRCYIEAVVIPGFAEWRPDGTRLSAPEKIVDDRIADWSGFAPEWFIGFEELAMAATAIIEKEGTAAYLGRPDKSSQTIRPTRRPVQQPVSLIQRSENVMLMNR